MAAAAGLAGAAVVVLLGRTLRVERVEGDDYAGHEGAVGRRIFAFWHGELLALAYTHRRRDICVLVSRHRDGECVARVLNRLGFRTARGSTSDAGLEGAFQMCANLKNGRDAAVAPDGPKGPARRVQPGIVYLAQRTGASLIPTACLARRRVLLGSWDRFQVPLPFSRVAVVFGAPIAVPRRLSESEVEKHRAALESAMEEACVRAEDTLHSGRVPRSRKER